MYGTSHIFQAKREYSGVGPHFLWSSFFRANTHPLLSLLARHSSFFTSHFLSLFYLCVACSYWEPPHMQYADERGSRTSELDNIKKVWASSNLPILYSFMPQFFFVFTYFVSITRFSISPITAWFAVIIDVKYWLSIQLYFLCLHAVYASGMRIAPLFMHWDAY